MCADANSLDVLPSLPEVPQAEELERLRMALEQAQRREHELDDTFENGAMPLHWVGPDGTILRANRAELELLGYSRDEYVGHNIAEFHADESVIAELLRRLHADEVVRNYAARLRCRDGSIRHVLIDSSVYRADEEFIHTRCFTRDVTISVLATEALRYSEERFHLAAEATRDLIWDWDVVGCRGLGGGGPGIPLPLARGGHDERTAGSSRLGGARTPRRSAANRSRGADGLR